MDRHPLNEVIPSRSTQSLWCPAVAAAVLCTLVGASAAFAQTPDTTRRPILDTVKVVGRIDELHGIATTASQGHVGAADLAPRPISREGELLETVPGMVVTQHSGDGKANQYFIRGFNLDHGTDFQTRLEGMPLNMPTHGHGQGYTDLNFLIPELVDHVDYELGVSHPEIGDFGSAGSAEFHMMKSLDHGFVNTEFGQNRFDRVVGGYSHNVGPGTILLGGESKNYDGPWTVGQGVRKRSGLARYTAGGPLAQISILAMGYINAWKAPDQIPQRALSEGILSRFGELDSTDGGMSRRFSLSATATRVGSGSTDRIEAFAIRSDLTLFSDFTYFLSDTVRGDQFSQTDHRWILGGRIVDERELDALGAEHMLRLGLESRTDLIDSVGLFLTDRRQRYDRVREDAVHEAATALFAAAESNWGASFRSILGLRADGYAFHVVSDLAANSGHTTAGILSPKASLAYAPSKSVELYLSGGYGFHSNDARGSTLRVDPSTGGFVSAVTPLVRSRGAEAGLRMSPVDGLRTTVSAWLLNLDSELLFTGDAGITEPSAATHRGGISLANFYRVSPRLAADADVSLTHAAFVGQLPRAIILPVCSIVGSEGASLACQPPSLFPGASSTSSSHSYIPGAIERVVTAGITVESARNAHSVADRLSGSLRLRHFGSYALVDDNSVRSRPSTLLNAEVGYHGTRDADVRLSILNLLNTTAADIAYYYVSRLRGESAAGVSDIHLHPAEPRQVRLSVRYRFR